MDFYFGFLGEKERKKFGQTGMPNPKSLFLSS